MTQALARIDELEASADTGFLLDISNRRGFERELDRSISYIKRYYASGALIVLDVDRLKPIDDAFGHSAARMRKQVKRWNEQIALCICARRRGVIKREILGADHPARCQTSSAIERR